MEIVLVSLAAFALSILTFFSGFGLGTLLTPVFMLFFPVELAIALTGVVHFFNNLFKLLLVGRKADRDVLIRFGIPAVIAALAGSWLLLHIPNQKPLYSYQIGAIQYNIYIVKFIISILLLLFVCIDFIPAFNKIQFDRNKLPLGGVLSGFFGGLSGNQGALRAAFLMKAGLSKESFIATTVVVSTFVDLTRLSVYSTRFNNSGLTDNLSMVLGATLAGIAGSYAGNKLLKKIKIEWMQVLVAIMLIALSVALGLGLI